MNDLSYYRTRKMGDALGRPLDPTAHAARSYRRVLEHVGGMPGTFSVLDVCCGLGTGSHFLGTKVRRVTGVDFSATAIEFACLHYAIPGQVDFRVGDVTQLSLAEEFDAAIMVDVLEHFSRENAIRVLRRVLQALRPGGEIILHVPLGATPSARFRRLYKRVRTGIDHTGDSTHVVTYNLSDVLALCREAGLIVRRWNCRHAAPPVPSWWISRLSAGMSARSRIALADATAISVDLRVSA